MKTTALLAAIWFAITFAAVTTGAAAVGDDATAPPGWVMIAAGKAFTFEAPRDTARYSGGGTALDSFVEMFRNTDFELGFDYGQFSNDLSGFRAKRNFSFQQTIIDGRQALIVTGPANNDWGCHDYVSAVYIVVSHSRWSGRTTRLEMNGCTKSTEKLRMLHEVFHSLHFLDD
jgi:hypothetical protein